MYPPSHSFSHHPQLVAKGGNMDRPVKVDKSLKHFLHTGKQLIPSVFTESKKYILISMKSKIIPIVGMLFLWEVLKAARGGLQEDFTLRLGSQVPASVFIAWHSQPITKLKTWVHEQVGLYCCFSDISGDAWTQQLEKVRPSAGHFLQHPSFKRSLQRVQHASSDWTATTSQLAWATINVETVMILVLFYLWLVMLIL